MEEESSEGEIEGKFEIELIGRVEAIDQEEDPQHFFHLSSELEHLRSLKPEKQLEKAHDNKLLADQAKAHEAEDGPLGTGECLGTERLDEENESEKKRGEAIEPLVEGDEKQLLQNFLIVDNSH